jgi:hypothetical protein
MHDFIEIENIRADQKKEHDSHFFKFYKIVDKRKIYNGIIYQVEKRHGFDQYHIIEIMQNGNLYFCCTEDACSHEEALKKMFKEIKESLKKY